MIVFVVIAPTSVTGARARHNDILDTFVIAYIDDILVFSKTLQEHRKHVKTVLGQIQAAGLQLNIDKCEFKVQQTKY